MDSLYPWQNALWEDLQHRLASDKLPHALLFTGPVGIGKTALAGQFAYSLLCNHANENGLACGECAACHLLAAGSHPDIRRVEPDEPGKIIPVDRVRAIGEFLALKGQFGGRQVILVNPAEAMNRFAANSLLKNLEEPTPDALIILIASRPSLLLPTIRSRCQQIAFTLPEPAIAEPWLRGQVGANENLKTLLNLANGAPLEALRLHQSGGVALRHSLANAWLELTEGRADPLTCAAEWQAPGLAQALAWLGSWTMDLIRLKSGVSHDAIVNCDLSGQLQKIAGRFDLQQLFSSLDHITEYNRWAGGQLNEQLALEDIMLGWVKSGR